MSQFASEGFKAAAAYAAKELPRQAASLAAQYAAGEIASRLFGPVKRVRQGRALDEIRLLTAGEGGGVPRVYGRARVGGQVIWAGDVQETTLTERSFEGAKGTSRGTEEEATSYSYTLSLAIALCEGELAQIGRVWADGKLISLGAYDHRIYRGTNDQVPDPLIEAREGAAPSYRGLAYIVFEELPLGPFGNRVPQFNFEVECPVGPKDPESLEEVVRAVTIIPGSGEGILSMEPVFEEAEEGVSRALNRHNGLGLPDAEASFDRLQGTLPNTEAASLVVSWFGDDLRAGACIVRPGVELSDRRTEPDPWAVAGIDRSQAHLVTQSAGRPSYGGTPSDKSVLGAVRDLKARGLAVTFHPFILMDIPDGNGLPGLGGSTGQPSFPWRGRITSRADGSAGARADIRAFFTSYGAMVRHYAKICSEAGGVESFLLGSELRGLTRLRDETGAFPAVEELRALAAEVRAILPAAKISYGADWSEYASYAPEDGSGDLLYPLDDLWADGNIDFVGIDNYMPLSDWREGGGHLDAQGAEGPYDLGYLQANIRGGEGYDWYYASEEDRLSQTRTPITDGAYQEPWVFRYKDLWSWWSNPHEERRGGVKTGASPWSPSSKPIVFTELGCSAIDKGPNQPNVFLDPKSSESAPPHFSNGYRDDRAQRALLEAHHLFWADPANNPQSPVYGGPMVDAARIFVYAWDARPYPDFPARTEVWGDAENWVTGHWLNGRAGRVPLSRLLTKLARDSGLGAVDASACSGLVTGLALPGPVSGREAMEPLLDLFQLDAFCRCGTLIIRPRGGVPGHVVEEGELLLLQGEEPLRLDHAQDEELPAALSITYADELSGFALKTTEARDETRPAGRTARMATEIVLEQGEALARARAILAEARLMRTGAGFALPEIADGLEPGSVVTVAGESGLSLRITRIEEGPFRSVKGVRTDPGVFAAQATPLLADPEPMPSSYGAAAFELLDIPLIPEGAEGAHLWLAAFARPWPGAVAIHRGEGADGVFVTQIERQCLMGRLEAPLEPGPLGRWDRASELVVRLSAGNLASIEEMAVLEGRHLCAVETAAGWELLHFARAELLPGGSYRLSALLRARLGTEAAMLHGAGTGARFVLLKGAEPRALTPGRWGQTETFQAGPRGAPPGAYPFRSKTITLEGLGARPLPPVHLRARAEGSETVLSWTRRTRIGGDQLARGDVPLGETEERYLVILYDGAGAEIRRAETIAPAFRFEEPSARSASAAQLSSAFGPGGAAFITL